MAKEFRMIEPFADRQVRDGVISYGVSSYGYDMRVAPEFKIFTNALSAVVDPKHPITTGINDFTVKEEFYYKLKLPKGDHAVKPVLLAEIDGGKEMVAWSWERPDGGRSFGFTGLHFHENWKNENYQKLVVQGVLWSVKK